MENEIRLIEIYGPEFEIDSYFIEDLKKYGTEKNEALLESENSELSKKERKNAKRKYDDVAAKFDFYKKIYDSAVLLLVKLDNYYLN